MASDPTHSDSSPEPGPPGPPGDDSDAGDTGAGPPLPPPPSIWSFAERGPGRIVLESLLGAAAGFLVAGAMELEAIRWHLGLLGGSAAPIALLLTPIRGPLAVRALRYGGALAVLVTLAISFAGDGRDRPIGELLLYGLFSFFIGTVAHGAMLLTLDREPAGRGT